MYASKKRRKIKKEERKKLVLMDIRHNRMTNSCNIDGVIYLIRFPYSISNFY